MSATAELVIDEGCVNISDGSFIAESNLCTAADKFLPERSGLRCGWIDLKLERALEANPIQDITKQAGETGGWNENLHRIGLAGLEARYRAIYAGNFYKVHLPCEATSDELVNNQMYLRLLCPGETADLVSKLGARIVASDAHRTMQLSRAKFSFKLLTYINVVIYCHCCFLTRQKRQLSRQYKTGF